MADPRELILDRLLVIAQGIDGIVAAARNTPDVPGIKRPAIIVNDGIETFLDKPDGERRARIQRVELHPVMVILMGAPTANVGTLLNQYRALLLSAVMNDATLGELLWPNGEVGYLGCTVDPIVTESREGRMEVHCGFTYIFRQADL